MAKIITPDGGLEVKKSEAIVKARYKLSPLAIKFISIVISNLKRSDDINEEYVVKVKEFKEFTGQKTKRIYELIDEALNDLLKNPLTIPLGDEKNSILKANWVSGAIYNNGEVKFMIYPKLRPFLIEVKEKYLKYRLENILNLKSSYVIRLYEILKDWLELNKRYGNLSEKIIEVAELRDILEIPKSYKYGNSSGIKQRILEKAKAELAEHTDIIFDYEEIKTGRKVTHLKFVIRKNPTKTEEYRESKINYNLKSVRHFISFLRKNYVDKCFGYTLIAGNVCWLKINDKGLVYGVLDSGEIKNFNSGESDTIYNNWWQVAKADWFYQKAILEDMEEFDKIYKKNPDFRLSIKQTINYLKEENLLK